ncbi:ABC transporter substrate-binding protein [Streptomyces litchfieldiae]|uniref:ABC transporter substrate-binding protein n=1 Tax=Streptomyces litchfieldiae TaxID=3075543 RepID=A0ABU2MVN7_9ACTN|nr:ABC transporter substrate-binding protein [Streptomyces sp. DSM 44938]MDT0345708.1 ABC transporter substrate-binding protein [Streptomyces sp. DSM 44938]
MSWTRRDVLRLTGMTAGAVAGWSLLAACGSSSDGSAGPVEGAGTAAPRRGGTVRLAFAGGGAGESLDPFAAYSPADLVRGLVLFDRLFNVLDGAPSPALAVSAEPAADAMSFTLTLRQNVTWHDGSPLTAADVAYSLAYLTGPGRTFASELPAYLDIERVSADGELTLTVPTLRPVGDPATLLAGAAMTVIKEGTTSFSPGEVLGTGAFRVTAFEAGREARLTRYEDYWGGPAPADELVIVSVDEAQARVNAAQGGQVDYASDIPYTAARTGAGAAGLEVRDAGAGHRHGYGFVLNTTRELMADPRVRMALRLGVDRQALVDTVFLGYGTPGNDLFGHGAQYFADGIPALERDTDRARALLAEAGADGARLTIRSGDYEVGLNASTELFVEQLRELGLDARAQIVSSTEYFDPEGIAAADALAFTLGPFLLHVIYNRSAAFPSLAFEDEELEQALADAAAATREGERARAWRAAQEVMADRGNWVVWGLGDVLSLAREDLTGVEVRESPKYPYVGEAGFTA